ncbi:hypothetical protein GO730_23150 [Spirosoma sp. HMF3257]|uniref:CN hydrolase domain-containing protein n=1 Tax=Spirosoma telluris TaxID=2183553 RepID=A0A327NMB9_9BACT|nr:hypothetical protein [Spirosoma telluris]RAI76337.1 hypothetical protein HMF3257_23095 [Spirosoma telluris]
MAIYIRKYAIILLIGFLLCWGILGIRYSWLNDDLGKPLTSSKSSQLISHIEQFGTQSGQGNLLGIQPWMEPTDYRDGLTFRNKLAGYLKTARDSNLIIPNKTIVILPEYLGTWLVAMNEPTRVYTASTIQEAMTAMVIQHPIPFWQTYRAAPKASVIKRSTPYSP